jgi:Tol biopolymer transport system component
MFPKVSRDGRQVVFGWWDWARPAEWQLRVASMTADGAVRVLYDGRNTGFITAEAWSPDGRWIAGWRALEDPAIQLVMISAAGDSVRVLKTLDWRNPIRMDFSPDGRWIVYDFPPDQDTEQRDVYALAVDGSREHRLVEHPAEDFVLGWAPDGRVLFASERTGTPGAWLLPVANGRATGSPELVKADLFEVVPVAFLEDGAYMYGIKTGSRDVYVASLDERTGAVTGSPVRIAARGMGSTQLPTWSPDGRHLAYVIQQGPSTQARRTLGIRSIETGEMRELPLSNRLGYVQVLHWMPDGGSLLLQATDDKGRTAFVRFDVQTGRSEPLLHRPPDVSLRPFEIAPDGATLILNEEDNTNEPLIERRIIVKDLRSGSERVILRKKAPYYQQIRHIALSPDGQELAFVNWHGNAPHHEIMVMPIAGGEPRLVASSRVISLRWASDGRYLLFAEAVEESLRATTRILRVSVDGGVPEPVGITMADIQSIRVHGPSRRIAFTAGRPQAELWIMDNFLPGWRTRTSGSGS